MEECGESCVRTSPFLFTSDLQMVGWTQRLQAQQQRHDASKEHLNQMQKSLSAVRAGVEHLTGRLHHVTLVNRTSNVSTKLQRWQFFLCQSISALSLTVKMSAHDDVRVISPFF